MSDQPTPSAPDFTKAGMGAMGDVNNVYDTSQRTVNNTTHNSTNTSHSHHEDKSQHIDQSVTKQSTVHHSGLSPMVLFAVICVLMTGFILIVMAFRAQESKTIVQVTVPAEQKNEHDADPSRETIPPRVSHQVGDKSYAPVSSPAAPVEPDQTALVMPEPSNSSSILPAKPSDAFHIQFDREDRLYHDKDTQSVRITVPRDGYLYVASVWANGEMRMLCHPDWLQPVPGRVTAGQIVAIPAINMIFTPPNHDDVVTEEEIRAIISDRPIPGLPADRKADVNQAWRALSFPVQAPAVRYRGGELPDPETLRNSQDIVQTTAAYRMRRGTRQAP